MKVLVTCPPMIGLLDQFRDTFAERGIEVHVPDFVQVMSEAALIEILPEFNGWIIGDDPATGEVFRAGHAGKLRAAVKWGIGVDNVDFDTAEALGMSIVNTPDVFGNEVADLGLSYLISLARQTYVIDRGVRAGEWPKPAGISLQGRVAGLVGFGDIGRQLSSRMAACGLEQIVYDPGVAGETTDTGMPVARWPERIEELDFLAFACALNEANRHMFGAEVLDRLKPGLRIVNVARGPLIDETALIAGLASGAVHSAALDVMEVEPLPMDSPLRDYPLCIFGSHNASNTRDAVIRTTQMAIDNLCNFLEIPYG